MSANHVPYLNQNLKSKRQLGDQLKVHTVQHSKKVSLMNQRFGTASGQRVGSRLNSEQFAGHSHNQSVQLKESD